MTINSYYNRFNCMVTIKAKLAEKFSPDNYKAITMESCIEEERKLEKRIDEFTKKVEEDLKHADKVDKEQKEIAADLVGLEARVIKLQEQVKLYQQANGLPSCSLDDIELTCSSQSINKS